VAVPGDLALPSFGLANAAFAALADQIDLIVHCGAATHWLERYTYLKPVNVLGTVEVIRLAAPRLIPIHHISSVGIFPLGGSVAHPVFDERTPLDHGGVLLGGYAQSKWVAEKLMANARTQGLSVTVHRPSLIVGAGRTGVWLGDSLVLNMLRSWIELGAAPEVEAELDLVPVDYVSDAIAHAIACGGGAADHASDVYHLNNPQPVPVQALAAALADSGYRLRSLPYPAWRTEMLSRGDRRRQAMLDAVAPLLGPAAAEGAGWMARIPHCGNHLTQRALDGLTCPPVDAPLLRRYVAYLQRAGSLPPPT